MTSDLIVDPIHDGATDPVLIWDRGSSQWWCLFVHRHANTKIGGPARIGRCHGTQVAVASSPDGGENWLYRGTLSLPVEPGLNTFWGPDVVFHAGTYHMFVTFIRGVPDSPSWDTYEWPREIHHLTSTDLWNWTHVSRVDLGTDYVVDPHVYPLPEGGWALWFKDETRDGTIWQAISPDLYEWKVADQALSGWNEAPAVFELGDWAWMVAEGENGLTVHRSKDLQQWEPRTGLDVNGQKARGVHIHPISDTSAYILYYTQTGKNSFGDEVPTSGQASTIRVAELTLVGDDLVCRPTSTVDLSAGRAGARVSRK